MPNKKYAFLTKLPHSHSVQHCPVSLHMTVGRLVWNKLTYVHLLENEMVENYTFLEVDI